MGGSAEFLLSKTRNAIITTRWDILYVQKGWKYDYYYDSKYEVSADEIVIAPFLVLRLHPLLSGQIIPFAQFGPELGVNMVYDLKRTSGIYDEFLEDYEKSPIPWNDMNLSINFGFGVAIPMGKGELIIDFRDNIGLVNMTEEPFQVTTQNFQLFLGYNFFFPTRRP